MPRREHRTDGARQLELAGERAIVLEVKLAADRVGQVDEARPVARESKAKLDVVIAGEVGGEPSDVEELLALDRQVAAETVPVGDGVRLIGKARVVLVPVGPPVPGEWVRRALQLERQPAETHDTRGIAVCPDVLGDQTRLRQDVVIHEEQKPSSSLGRAVIARRRGALVGLGDHPHVARPGETLHRVGRAVGRTVVDDDDLPLVTNVDLREQQLQASLDDRPTVVRGYDDAELDHATALGGRDEVADVKVRHLRRTRQAERCQDDRGHVLRLEDLGSHIWTLLPA